jgi:hypothetical protein
MLAYFSKIYQQIKFQDFASLIFIFSHIRNTSDGIADGRAL